MKNLTVLVLSFLLLTISCQNTSEKTTDTTKQPNTKNTIEKPQIKSGSFFVDIENINIDTYSQKNLFYSYRRSCHNNEKNYGRCISVILMT